MRKFVYLITAVALVSCSKAIQPSDLEGEWRSSHEEWAIDNMTSGEITTPTFDCDPFKGSNDCARLSIVNTDGDTYLLTYLDRYHRGYTSMEGGYYLYSVTVSAHLKERTLYGDNGEKWSITSVDGDRMTLEYDTGEITESISSVEPETNRNIIVEYKVRRQCRFTFRKISAAK